MWAHGEKVSDGGFFRRDGSRGPRGRCSLYAKYLEKFVILSVAISEKACLNSVEVGFFIARMYNGLE